MMSDLAIQGCRPRWIPRATRRGLLSIGGERNPCRHRTRLPKDGRVPATRGGTVPIYTTADHPARVACVPEGVRRASPGCLPRRSLPSRPRRSGRALAARGQPRVSTARGRRDRWYCKGEGKVAPRTDRDGPTEYDRDKLSWPVTLHGFPKQPVSRVLRPPAADLRPVTVERGAVKHKVRAPDRPPCPGHSSPTAT